MDSACCFHQPTLSTNRGFSNNSPLHKLSLHDRFLDRRACRNVLRNLSVCRVHASETKIRTQSSPRRNYPVPRPGYSFQEFLAFPSGDACKNFRVVKLQCQKNGSVPYIGDNVDDVHSMDHNKETKHEESNLINGEDDVQDTGGHTVSVHREFLHKAAKELEAARLNRSMYEQKAQKISETAITLKDEASKAWEHVHSTMAKMKKLASEEAVAKEAVEEAIMTLSMAEARVKVAKISSETNVHSEGSEEIKLCKDNLVNCEVKLQHIQGKKEELEKMVDELNEAAEKVQMDALKAEEEVSSVMVSAEQAVAFEVEAAKKVSDAKLALQEAERSISTFLTESGQAQVLSADAATGDDWNIGRKDAADSAETIETSLAAESTNSPTVAEVEAQELKCVMETKTAEVQSDSSVESSLAGAPKTQLKKSSRFFPASFFSFTAHVTLASAVRDLLEFSKSHLPQLVIGLMLLGAGISICTRQPQRDIQVLQSVDIFTRTEDILSSSRPYFQKLLKFPSRLKTFFEKLPTHELNEEEISHFDMLWLLLASVVFVPIFQKIPGGSPVLGYLAAGILIGPYGLSIIHHVHGTKAIAEFGVIFLLFNIGLELSVERLCSMKKYVFGLGSAQVLVTTAMIGCILHFISGYIGPAAIVIGSGLTLSSTAVVLQVLQERGESTSRHGRATFSVLLFQDLSVVVLLILIPLLSPNSSKGGVGLRAIAEALGLAAIKALAAISGIIAGGRLLLRPIYKQIADNQNAEIFSANTLLVILGTSLLTAKAGLSMALGAFLAGLLLAETEFSLQIESDIAPYRGLLLGLFFMTVGMSIDPKLLVSNFPSVIGALGFLIIGKATLVGLVGKIFGLSLISAIRVGLLLAPGGEFAFVAFSEAVNQGIMSSQLSSFLFLVVGMSMALTPWLAAGGQFIASRFELHDVRNLIPYENETDDLHDHIIICGYGRVGQIIAQLLSERLIPFVVLDVRSDRVAAGRSLDLPVYFGDSGSREVLHKVGAERACAAAVTLDTPGSNYRAVWALNKYFPNVKTFVRAHDVNHGINLEKAGATAVVPEILEPSLQLAAAVLARAKLPKSEIASTINEFRTRHLAELRELCEANESSLGYGFAQVGVTSKSSDSRLELTDSKSSESTVAS